MDEQTYVYKTLGPLQLNLDVYLQKSDGADSVYSQNTPIVLYFHAGGLVAYSRRSIPPHIVQSCLVRRWPLVSADYRLLPQASGKDLLDDVRSAYDFTQSKLPELLGMKQPLGTATSDSQRVIVAGSSAGAFLAFLAGMHMEPRPIAVFSYYGIPTFQHDFFCSGKVLWPVRKSQIECFLNEPVSVGTSAREDFSLDCLLPDGSQNMKYERPAAESTGDEFFRGNLYDWLVQENKYPELVRDVDKGLGWPGWSTFPPTILIHGDADTDVPFDLSQLVARAIGLASAWLFTAPGKEHMFDQNLFLGDPGLAVVEDAWRALDEIVNTVAE